MPQFELFTKRMTRPGGTPTVTIQKRGVMSFNKAAHQALGDAEAVELLYDPTEKIIGFRPADDPNAKHSYRLRSVAGKARSTFMISGTAFANYYEIDTSESRRWDAYVDDGILCVDLKGEFTAISGNRSKPGPVMVHSEGPNGRVANGHDEPVKASSLL